MYRVLCATVRVALALPGLLAVNAPGAVPFIDILNPPSGVQGATQPLSLSIKGANFMPGAVVNFNGVTLTPDSLAVNQLHVTVPASNLAKMGTANVTVVNPATAPANGTSNVAFFAITIPTTSVAYVAGTQLPNYAAAATGDFNNDGKLDVAILQIVVQGLSLSASAQILLGDGSGRFTAKGKPIAVVGIQEMTLAVGDFNADGNLDVAMGFTYPAQIPFDEVAIALGDGKGNLGTAAAVTNAADVFALGDFNGDGNLDIAIAPPGSAVAPTGSVNVLLGDGKGNFSAGPLFMLPSIATALAAGDFNGDGKPDLAVKLGNSPGTPTMAILLGDGAGGFTTSSYPIVGNGPYTTQYLATGDFNGDGNLDVAVPTFNSEASSTINVLLGDGTGNFSSVSSPTSPLQPSDLLVADFNGDGNLDVVLQGGEGNALASQVLLGDGKGHFTPAGPPLAASTLVTGDFNGDGRLDFATPGSVLLQSTGPLCSLTGIVAGPPKQLQVTMQDIGSGLNTIQLVSAVNATVDLPPFTPGTTSPVVVTATKVDQSGTSDVAFTVKDMAGNSITCDPVDFTAQIEGRSETHVFRDLSASEHYIRIVNGTPGLKSATFDVNGKSFPVTLSKGRTVNLDIGSAMQPGDANKIVMTAQGPRRSSATVLIGDASVGQ